MREEAAAIAAAIEQVLTETAPALAPAARSRWLDAALREGVEARLRRPDAWSRSPR
jgi:hypothetical protein